MLFFKLLTLVLGAHLLDLVFDLLRKLGFILRHFRDLFESHLTVHSPSQEALITASLGLRSLDWRSHSACLCLPVLEEAPFPGSRVSPCVPLCAPSPVSSPSLG